MRRVYISIHGTCATILLFCGCTPEVEAPPPPPDDRPSLLLVTIDTLRADRVGAYGDPLAKTPTLDRLASQGALFREAHATAPLTLPSHATILSGLLPAHHGLHDNAGFRLDDGVVTLAQRLQAAGYHTGAFVSAYVLDAAWGLNRGFDTYHAPFHPADVAKAGVMGELELPGAETVNAASAWWRATTGPRFLWVHLYDPHTPWAEHPGWTGDPYRGEVAWADSLLGKVVAAADGAWVIVASDHGEGLWDHGEREHGVLLGRSVTRVPLIVRPPTGLSADDKTHADRPGASATERPDGLDGELDLNPVPDAPRAARVIEQPVSLADITPTILDALAQVVPSDLDGRSLLPLINGVALPDRAVRAETWYPWFHLGWQGLAMAQDATTRVEQGVWTGLTDWQADPQGIQQLRSVSPEHAALAALAALSDPPLPGALPAGAAEALAALGYMTEAAPTPTNPPDPRDRVSVLAELRAAEGAEPALAVARLNKLIQAEPDLIDAWISRSIARAATGDKAGAYADAVATLARFPQHSQALNNAGALALELDKLDEALAFARRLETINPADARGWRLETAVHVRRKEGPEVIRAGNAGLAVAPQDPNLHYLVGLAEVQDGDAKQAITHFLAAEANGSRVSDLSLWLAYAYDRDGQIDQAILWYDRATIAAPHDARPWALAGVMLANADRCQEASRYLINLEKRGGGADQKVRDAREKCKITR